MLAVGLGVCADCSAQPTIIAKAAIMLFQHDSRLGRGELRYDDAFVGGSRCVAQASHHGWR
jgi:hypothetical protein